MQTIYQCTASLRSWSSLQCLEDRDIFTEVSTLFGKGLLDLLSKRGGW
jgi:hypothetical protein